MHDGLDDDVPVQCWEQWLLSLYLMGAACAQYKIGGSFVKGVDQNFPFF